MVRAKKYFYVLRPCIKEQIRSLPEEHGQGYDELNELFLKYLW